MTENPVKENLISRNPIGRNNDRRLRIRAFAVLAGLGLLALGVGLGAQTQSAPKYKVDCDWPKPLPNKWKMGGVTGLAVDKDDNVWVYDRPNDLTDIELEAELTPPIADCCVRPPSMIHIDKEGNVIGSFDPPQGHGMAVDSKGFVYLGNAVNGMGNVRKYDPKTGQMLAECPACPNAQPGGGGGDAAGRSHVPGHGSAGPVAGFIRLARWRTPSARSRGLAARDGSDSGLPRQVSPDHAHDRRRNRRSSPRRTGTRTLLRRQLPGRSRHGV